MKRFTKSQRKIVTDFLTTIAAGWFGAGVITTVFSKQVISFDAIKNLVLGVLLAFSTLRYAVYLEKRK